MIIYVKEHIFLYHFSKPVSIKLITLIIVASTLLRISLVKRRMVLLQVVLGSCSIAYCERSIWHLVGCFLYIFLLAFAGI